MAKRLSGCGSGTEYLAVTPWGDFYPCHQFVGNEKFLLGNVDEGIKIQRSVMSLSAVMSAKENAEMFPKILLLTADARNAYNFSGDICGAYDLGCELRKKRIECARS